MKALSKQTSTEGLSLIDAPKPKIGHNDILIKIKKTAICGTDVHIYNWDAWSQKTIPVPMIIGHEYVGEVCDIGQEVQGFALGDRVSGEGHITCSYCRNCRAGRRHLCQNTQGVGVHRAGAFAEYLALPASNAFKVPDDISDDIAAIFDPLGNAVHTALSFDLVAEDVLITGAGSIGLMAAKICQHVGAKNVVITDISDYRLKLAQEMGIENTVNVSRENIQEKMEALHISEGFDVALEMSGAPQALQMMFDTLIHGGKIAMLGLSTESAAMDWSQLIFKGISIKGIYGREMFETWYKMSSLIQSGLDISSIITHRLPMEEFEQGFEIMRSGLSGKVILSWD